ncbi:porin (plasmid) [Ensifer adhaerens]|uniref:porin n=1 Tax=Ensifer adhaerens TaxID=106592 RepID=UPI003CE7D311
MDVDETYVLLGGLKAGFFCSWWEKGINGETDRIGNVTEFNSIGGSFQAGIASTNSRAGRPRQTASAVSLRPRSEAFPSTRSAATTPSGKKEEGAIRALLSADLGQVAGVCASNLTHIGTRSFVRHW